MKRRRGATLLNTVSCAIALLILVPALFGQTEGRYESPVPGNLTKMSATGASAAASILSPRANCLAGTAILDGAANQAEVFSTALQSFPTQGSNYLVLSTGYANQTAGTATTYVSHDMSGPTLTAGAPCSSPNNVLSFDVITLTISFAIPSGSSASLSFDWQFGSEENPTYTTSYTDYFRADVFAQNGTHLGNIARLPNNAQVTTSTAAAYSNTPGGSSAYPTAPFPSPNDVVFNAMTPKYTSTIDLSSYTGQTVTIKFRLADARDPILNSAVFIDNLDLAVCPNATFSLSPNVLWPPNHKMQTIGVTASGVPTCFSWTLASVTSNEPDNGEDDGNTVNDIQDVDAGTQDASFSVRAERSGIGTGRVYTATFLLTDANGSSCSYSAMVYVPLDQATKSPARRVEIPDVATLEQNYPNPFNPTTVIGYQLQRDADVTLCVHDLFGRLIGTLVAGKQSAGSYSVDYDASLLSSGVYVYTLTVDGATLHRSMLLAK